jgi:preprotein translocase subunit SecG
MLLNLLLVLEILVGLALTGVVLLQRSEGGAPATC